MGNPTGGTNAVFKIQDASNSLTDISGYLDKATLDRSAGTYDTSVFGVGSKQFIPGLKDGQIPLEGPWDATIDGVLAPILGFTARPFEYYPSGTGTGAIKFSGSAILNKYTVNDPVDGRVDFTGNCQITGNVTRAVV